MGVSGFTHHKHFIHCSQINFVCQIKVSPLFTASNLIRLACTDSPVQLCLHLFVWFYKRPSMRTGHASFYIYEVSCHRIHLLKCKQISDFFSAVSQIAVLK